MCLIVDLNWCVVYPFVWVHGLPLLGQSDKSPFSLKQVNIFQTVDLEIESVLAITKSDFPAWCNVTIASLLSDIFKLFKI